MTSSYIPLNYSIPEAVRVAMNNGHLALFIGAGVPRLLGCWGWTELAEQLIEKCLEARIINYSQREHLLERNRFGSNMQTISSCLRKLKQNDLLSEFDATVKKSCEIDQARQREANELYSALRRLAEFYITPNYDNHFDKYFSEEDVLYELEQFREMGKTGAQIDKNRLYHIHGSIKNPRSIVLTEEDYIRYTDPYFVDFLVNIFRNHSMLFIGYGLEEPPMRSLLHKASTPGRNSHFALIPYFSHEIPKYEEDIERLGAMGVSVVSYIRDKRDYFELYEVIRSWDREVRETELVVR